MVGVIILALGLPPHARRTHVCVYKPLGVRAADVRTAAGVDAPVSGSGSTGPAREYGQNRPAHSSTASQGGMECFVVYSWSACFQRAY